MNDLTVNAAEYGQIFNVVSCRVQENKASAYRLATKPDGTLVLQGGFMWSEGVNGGIEWCDIPTVRLDEEGNAK